ncbi:Zn(II)2Cys6 transcription factor domain-containing protein [Aspergillus luchuensis]|uniref:Zn(2)-C6 fungal-type domain-containing protein n=1 Tax=Aspergillus kawachii TaxID=1069201 RepID=A0A7R7WBB1_ASPKA|nr:uncharacterized protein AKAW2_50152A [Aspergillus luchuensis]BCR99810.1 hypothetical protein AKAW2_50152A [Aspergillus luchuensis]
MNKETSEYPHRQLLPKVSLGKVGHSHSPVHAPSKRRSLACTNCRRKHIKCTGPPSCETCVHSGRACVFEPSKDRRRKEALRHAEKATERYRNALVMVIQTFKSGADQDVRDLVDRMKQSSSVDDSLAELQEMTHREK